jgi:murein DD-endopeptidase MepM/ murein hydrolase activator NlpD
LLVCALGMLSGGLLPSISHAQRIPTGLGETFAGDPSKADAANAAQAAPATEAEGQGGPGFQGSTSYTVQPGDTMASIGRKHGVSIDALVWANKLPDADSIKVGQTIEVPRTSGRLYVVAEGDSLDSIAQSANISVARLAIVNGLEAEDKLEPGQRILIPSPPRPPAEGDPAPKAEKPADEPTKPAGAIFGPGAGSGLVKPSGNPAAVNVSTKKVPRLSWPIQVKPPLARLTTPYSANHRGIDIASPTGTPIKAASGGTVSLVEKSSVGYGWRVVIDHGDTVSTLYSHLSSFSVLEGDKVQMGQKLGEVGSTGLSTGPHLHFELRVSNVPINPRIALPDL